MDDKPFGLFSLTLVDMINLVLEIFSQIYIEGTCHGKLLEDEAKSLENMFKELFSATILPYDLWKIEKILKLPSRIFLFQNENVKIISDPVRIPNLNINYDKQYETACFPSLHGQPQRLSLCSI